MPRTKLDREGRHRIIEAALRRENQSKIAKREGVSVNRVGVLKREALKSVPHYRRVLEILDEGAGDGT